MRILLIQPRLKMDGKSLIMTANLVMISMAQKIGRIIWDFLIDKEKEIDISQARMTEKEVLEKALSIAREENWDRFEPDKPMLRKNGRRLVWIIRFFLSEGENKYFIGGHVSLEIDDETGELIKKHYVPR